MIRMLMLATAILAMASCERRGADPVTATPVAAPQETTADTTAQRAEQAELQAHLGELDAKIARLEGRISAADPVGTGAYARGSTLRVEGNGKESVLERLRRVERELSAATATASAKDATIRTLTAQRDEAMSTGREASEKIDFLASSRESLIAAQQTLAERQERISALNAQLATAELQRLRAERRWYALAGEVLRLTPEDARDLPEMQARIREATRDVRAEARP
jgi:septal ring factor EnvC (AmiA/AmiB activator)